MKKNIDLDFIYNLSNNVIDNDNILNKEKINEYKNIKYDIELESGSRYNQEKSESCWIFTGFNMISNNMAKNLNIDIKNLKFSSAYFTFFDHLEKSNALYQMIIDSNVKKIEKLKNRISRCISGTGNFIYFRGLIKKYGIIPYSCMESNELELFNSDLNFIYNNKIMNDAIKLFNMKTSEKNVLFKIKENMLKENFEILSKLYGKPPVKVHYTYIDKNNKKISLNMTPQQFKDKYLSLNLDDFIQVENYPISNRILNKKHQFKCDTNIYYGCKNEFLELKIDRIKKLIIKQLEDGVPVYILCDPRRMRDRKHGIIDLELYNINPTFLSKEDLIKYNLIRYMHAICIKAVSLKDGKPFKWKLENTYGTENNNGFIMADDKSFDLFLFSAMIDKKYIEEELVNEFELKKCKEV